MLDSVGQTYVLTDLTIYLAMYSLADDALYCHIF